QVGQRTGPQRSVPETAVAAGGRGRVQAHRTHDISVRIDEDAGLGVRVDLRPLVALPRVSCSGTGDERDGGQDRDEGGSAHEDPPEGSSRPGAGTLGRYYAVTHVTVRATSGPTTRTFPGRSSGLPADPPQQRPQGDPVGEIEPAQLEHRLLLRRAVCLAPQRR